MDPAVTPAPAPTDTPQTVPASDAAIVANDFGAFREAERAVRTGTPKPDVAAPTPKAEAKPVATPAPTETPEARELSKRQREQNERTRKAVEQATADLRAENERLKRQVTPPKPETPAPAAVASKAPEYKRYLAMPEAPKLADFDTIEEHSAAMSVFIADQRYAEREARAKTEQAEAAATADATKTIQTFQSQLTTAGHGDAKAFLDTLSPEVQALRPVEALAANGEAHRAGPLNVLASEIVKSARAPQLLQYFSTHPAELERFQTLPNVAAVYRALGLVEAGLDAPSPAAAVSPTLPAPPPPRVLTPRPSAAADPGRAALEKGDFRAFRAAERQARTA